MADTKITGLQTPQVTTNPATDVLPIVNIADNSMAASGSTRKITVNQLLGAGGTATLASATITGNLTAAAVIPSGSTVPTNGLYLPTANNLGFAYNSTLGMTLNSTGLGVGGSVINKLTVTVAPGTSTSDGFRVTDSTRTIIAGQTGATYSYLGIGGDQNLIYTAGGRLDIVADSQSLFLRTGTNNYLNLDSSGNVGIGVAPAGTGGCLQLKSGITFPATQVASSDANTLDDYEEGTWTGTLLGGNTNPTTPITATGRYTKVGRLVTVQINFDNVNTTGASGKVFINGIPFTNSSVGSYGTAASYSAATFTETLVCVIDPNETSAIVFMDIKSNAAWATADHNAGTGRYVRATITYTVA